MDPLKPKKDKLKPPPASERKLLQPMERDIIRPEDLLGKETTITA